MSSDIPEFFWLRLDERFHLGLGDVRITMDMQDAIEARIEELECHLAISKGKHENCIAEVERLLGLLDRVGGYLVHEVSCPDKCIKCECLNTLEVPSE
jgi:hypothetical protein